MSNPEEEANNLKDNKKKYCKERLSSVFIYESIKIWERKPT